MSMIFVDSDKEVKASRGSADRCKVSRHFPSRVDRIRLGLDLIRLTPTI